MINNTFKMPKGHITKSRISITLDTEILKHINNQCKQRTMKVSSYVEKLIQIGIKNESERK